MSILKKRRENLLSLIKHLIDPKTERVDIIENEEDKVKEIDSTEISHDTGNDEAKKNVHSEPEHVNEHEAVKGGQLQSDVEC